MIHSDQEFHAVLDRIAHFQAQVQRIREVEASPANYRASVSGFLAELDHMNLEVREYLSAHPKELLAVG